MGILICLVIEIYYCLYHTHFHYLPSDATHNCLNYSQLMIGQNSTVITMVAVSIFMLFVNINIGKVRCINYIMASSV